jgi:protocatechuate 3,4-dioxygenase beta subunit
MKFLKYLSAGVLAVALTACGGGGGSAGNTGVTAGAGGTGSVTTPPTAVASMTMDVLSGAGTSTTSISAIEISKVSITLKDAAGSPVPGAVVTFGETGAGLLTIAPVSKTALTDASGIATVEIRAATGSSVGATTVNAFATVAKAVVAAEKAISITSAPTGGGTDPLALANALNFLDVNPADKSIVLAGAGGNGRSESATLRFRVVDKNNTPVKGATVTFAAVPANDVTLNISSGASDADGVVVTTVSSKNVATAVVIKATVTRANNSTITSQSDQLLVTTGVATLAGFDLSASKYNLNFRITGDKTTITVRIVDVNGNPVADGVPVVFTAPFGAVGTSSRGGCVTLSGGCSVDYSVQDPRPSDGQLATVTASTQVGNGSSIGGTLAFQFVDATLLNLFANATGPGAATFTVVNSCAIHTFSVFAGTPASFPAPAGTTVEVTPITSSFTATLKSGTPIFDQLTSPPQRTRVDFEVDVSAIASSDACLANGTSTRTANFDVKFKAGTIETTRRIQVTYPAAP